MLRNKDYTTGNLLDYLHCQNCNKRIVIILSRKPNLSIPQQINFIEQLKQDNGVTMFFIAEKQHKTILIFSLDSLNVIE